MNLLTQQLKQISEFHSKIGAKIGTTPKFLETDKGNAITSCRLLHELLGQIGELASEEDTLLCRLCLTIEELAEWVQSHVDGDLIAAADALGDRAYLMFGDAVASGMPLGKIVDEIHRSNMSKSQSIDGKLGKATKVTGEYSEPNLDFIIKETD